MIISHKHKYLYIQLEKTASSAIAKELVENYDGEHILWKHATYKDFIKQASPEEKQYFKFAGIRNPLDIIPSRYHLRKAGTGIHNSANLRKYKFIKEKNASFSMFFSEFFDGTTFKDVKTKDYHKLDYIYKYENLQEEFGEILKRIKVKQKRPLPVFNKTEGKKDFRGYYSTANQISARMVFGNYMNRWGYKFPSSWKEPSFKDRLRNTVNCKIFFRLLIYKINRIRKKPIKGKVYIFFHIPKTGGSTIKSHIENNFEEDEILDLYDRSHNASESQNKTTENLIRSLTKEQKSKIKVIYGHNVCFGIHRFFKKQARYVTFLRNPMDAIISDYNHARTIMDKNEVARRRVNKKGKIIPFYEWLDTQKESNTILTHLRMRRFMDDAKVTHHKINSTLNKFYFIGLTQNPSDFRFFYSKLGISRTVPNENISEKYFVYKGEKSIKNKIMQKTKNDFRIYEIAKNRTGISRQLKKQFAIKIFFIKKCITYLKQNLKLDINMGRVGILLKKLTPSFYQKIKRIKNSKFKKIHLR